IVLSFTDRGMVTGYLGDPTLPDLVEARIAHMPDYGRSVVEQDNGQDARHAAPFGMGARRPKNFIVGHRDGLRDTFRGASRLAFQAAANPGQRNLGRLLASSLTANAVDHDEDATLGVNMDSVLIVEANDPRMAISGAPNVCAGKCRRHFR